MKRPLKFRSAFYTFDGKFSHFKYWGFLEDGIFASPGQNNNCERKFEEQFTGLTDKNGVEVFEGDIVIWGHLDNGENKSVVYYNNDEVTFFAESSTNDDSESYLDSTHMEVIGNIHEK